MEKIKSQPGEEAIHDFAEEFFLSSLVVLLKKFEKDSEAVAVLVERKLADDLVIGFWNGLFEDDGKGCVRLVKQRETVREESVNPNFFVVMLDKLVSNDGYKLCLRDPAASLDETLPKWFSQCDLRNVLAHLVRQMVKSKKRAEGSTRATGIEAELEWGNSWGGRL